MLLHGFGASSDHWRNNAYFLEKAGFRVYSLDLIGFGESSLDFELVYFIPNNNYSKAMEAQENINLGIMDFFEMEGIDFAFPTRTINLQPKN